MPAPVSIGHIHVHALRLASGAEALVARVLTVDGVAGFGFSFGREAFPARDMAAWDAAARGRGMPLYALFGRKMREQVTVVRKAPGERVHIDPFEFLSVEEVLSKVRAHEAVSLVAPHGHSWELSYCVALAAALPGKIVVADGIATDAEPITVSNAPGIDIDWSIEPGFGRLQWVP